MKSRFLVLLLPLTLGACGYNRIQTLDEQASSAKQQIEVQLQRRADLVPNLVATVKGYAAHEEAVFTEVANARASVGTAVRSGDPARQVAADAQLTGALGRLIAVAENYPQLKADAQFLRLQDELAGTENRIAVSRSDYNASVKDYNTYIRGFPQVVTAKVTGAKARPYYEAAPGSNVAPTVDFTKPAGAPK
ncbi:MAG TPA: LemA family protein [Gemmatimonadaceae bacterium]|nr:LemA family protein [Gemmatimonadaceae bacterium]